MRGGDSVYVLASFESNLKTTNGLGYLNPWFGAGVDKLSLKGQMKILSDSILIITL